MIRYVRMYVVALFLLLMVQCASFAVASYDQKVVQPPKTTASYDLSSEFKETSIPALALNTVVAEDWVCPDGRDITRITWWGAYWAKPGDYKPYSDWIAGTTPAGLQGFAIKVYENTNAPFSQPGAEKWSRYFDGTANQVKVGTVEKTPGVFEDYYKYWIDLDQADWISQTQGGTYWISIQAKSNVTDRQWGWHEADGNFGRNSMQKLSAQDIWYPGCGGHDMAFELGTAPEPGSLMVLGLGLVSMGGCVFRRRRVS
jgi:hypothetical protein